MKILMFKMNITELEESAMLIYAICAFLFKPVKLY